MLERIVYVFQHFLFVLILPKRCFCLMAFAHYKSTSFLLLSHILSLLFYLMYVNKRRFAENNREKVLLCAQTVVPLHRQKTNIDCLG